jgi:hypothetical protein
MRKLHDHATYVGGGEKSIQISENLMGKDHWVQRER